MNINQVWPEWNEDCVLGEGSFGKVYRAKRVEYGRTFYSAIKVITVPKNQQEVKLARTQGMNDEEIYNYFRGLVDNLLNEITLMDNLKGAKNVVGIDDYKIVEHEGEIGWDIFIRMELLTPFDSFVSNPEFSQKDVIKLGIDICTALEACEQNCIVHRDIKPDNIFISRFGEYKLGDFGIARKLEVTQANLSRKGTLNYMAPEIYKGEEYGSSVDIYSLGLVLYTLLNNNRVAFLPSYPQPISYKDNEEALSKRLSGAQMQLPCNAGVSLGNAIVKACAYRPQDRYQSATEFKQALVDAWNVLVQTGDDRGIVSDAIQFAYDKEQKLQRTTNDMTANGRLVVDEYAQGTTVLNNEQSPTSFQNSNTESDRTFVNSTNYTVNDVSVPQAYSSVKSNNICRVISWMLAIVVCVFSLVIMFEGDNSVEEQMISFPLLGVGLTILLTDRNKIAVGVCALSLSLIFIIEGLWALLDGLQDSISAHAIVFIVSGLLLLLGGIVIISQKEVRFGGSLCVYAFAIEWLFNIYQMINDNFSTNTLRIGYEIAIVTIFIWSYGYKSDAVISKLKKTLHIATYILAAVVAVKVITGAVTVFDKIIG